MLEIIYRVFKRIDMSSFTLIIRTSPLLKLGVMVICLIVFAHAKKVCDRGHACTCTLQKIRIAQVINAIRSLHGANNLPHCFDILNYQ